MIEKLASYFNTTFLTGTELSSAINKAKSQDDAIRDFFTRTDESYTPFEVQALVLPDSPVTSVRRSMTNLTNSGFLVKTNEQKNGIYKRLNYCWMRNGWDL